MTTLRDLLRDFATDIAHVDVEAEIVHAELARQGIKKDYDAVRADAIENHIDSALTSIKERIIG
jgi:hypothetical protein